MAVRLAKASDLAATSRIAFRGFILSPWNAFYRPFASAYLQEVEKSCLREQQEALGNQNKLFTVVELRAEDRDANVDPYRASVLFSATESAVQKYLGGHMELDNVAVDPDHFRKGYGTLLCRHGMEIAREGKVPIRLIAEKLRMKL
ncbi:hypothetical protein FDENT_7191 [Fusarium denticulatum]|uniref:N-acetyltransferase domain-containing protein n=1 Tax=Fusarium denticulatum TaxID=48507 RepID=A0A8H5UA95_9HYPO|nr:hypothetical protein FDENT_7191 [Fusarium denticulatum]